MSNCDKHVPRCSELREDDHQKKRLFEMSLPICVMYSISPFF